MTISRKIPLAVALLLMCLSAVTANLIGLDFGSTYMKATLVKPG